MLFAILTTRVRKIALCNLALAWLCVDGAVAQTIVPHSNAAMTRDATQSPASHSANAVRQQVWVVQYIVNGRKFGTDFALERDGRWWVPQKSSELWGVKVKANAAMTLYRSQSFVPVDALGINETAFDSLALVLNITFNVSEFVGSGVQNLAGDEGFVPPTQQATGGFVNYDLLATSVSQRGTRSTAELAAEIELGAFSPLGSLIGSAKVLKQSAAESGVRQPPVVREYTTYRIDWPENIWTLEVGDSAGKAGIWGRPVVFGGINFRTNFLTRPGFITYPLPAFSGAAVIPSTASVLIDNVRRANLGFSPGPFNVSNIPVISGSNEVSLVVRDSLGRETVMRQQFYASLDLLKPGLHDFSVETGVIRQNFGLRSFDYKQAVFVGQSRYGWNDKFTTEARFEQVGKATTLGFGAIVVVPIPAVATVAVAASHVNGTTGSLVLAGVEKRERDWSIGLRGQRISVGFIQLGNDRPRTNSQQSYTAYVNTKLGRDAEFGGLGLAFADTGSRELDGGKSVTATWTKSLRRGGNFSFTALYGDKPKRTTQFSAMFTHPLGPRLSVSSDASRNSSGATSASVSAATSLDNVQEVSWRARIAANASPGTSASTYGDAAVNWRAPTFDTSVGVSVSRETQAARLALSGAVGIADGVGFMSRSLHDGFGVIRTPGMTGIPITSNGRVVAVSDGNGVAVVPRVIPYQQNIFRVDLKRLPLNIETDDDKVVLVPAYRSAAIGQIKLFRAVSALMVVTDHNGDPIPLGTEVNLLGSSERYVVGRGGRLYLSRLQKKNEIVIVLESGECRLTLEIPERHFSPLVDGNRRLQLGNQICK